MGEKWPMNFALKIPDFHVTFRDLLHTVNIRHGTNGFTSLPKDGVLSIFFALKNPTASAGFELANLGTKGQHATSRPPKPLKQNVRSIFQFIITLLLCNYNKTYNRIPTLCRLESSVSYICSVLQGM